MPSPANIIQEAAKRRIALRYWLLGKGYTNAVRALDINERLFPGTRKDGITPSFDHHISQASYARTLVSQFLYPEETLATFFFHDTPEDTDMSPQEIAAFYPEATAFGQLVAAASWRLTKKWRGTTKDEGEVFAELAKCPIASLVKGCDRIHNVQSMPGVFSRTKQLAYLEEVDRLFLPMLKEAERNFPQQEMAYKNIRTMLKSQRDLLRAALNGTIEPPLVQSAPASPRSGSTP